jgi:integrase
MTIEQARGKASELNAQIARGENPRDELKPTGDPTLGEFFDRYLIEHRPRGNPSTESFQLGVRKAFDRCLTHWRNRRLSEITRADVERLHGEIVKARGPVAANRLVALLSSIFTDARHWGVYHSDNPASGIKKVSENPRTRLLGRDGELAAFRKALEAEPDRDLRLYLMLRLYNGVRQRNIFEMRWTDLDLDRGKWHIGDTKNGDPLLVPLATPTVEELRVRAKAFTDGKNTSPFVFPGRHNGEHLGTLNKRWWRFRKALNLGDVQLRDLRRTFGSWALWAGNSREVIAQAMGHRPGSRITASVYAFADDDMKRNTVDATTQKMLEAGGKTQQVAMRQKPRGGRKGNDEAQKAIRS